MSEQFSDIHIVELDDSASGPSGQGALMRLVLKLSSQAPGPWANYFNEAWTRHFYMMKRTAKAYGNRVEIVCMPEELQPDHIPELKKVIAETNDAYRNYVAEQAQVQQAMQEQAQAEKDKLAALKGSLKFD